MSNKGADAYQRAVDQFWHNYLSILEKSSIPAKSRLWYRKHIEAYIDYSPGVKLQQHLPAHVDKNLTAKGRNTQLLEWQFRPIADALRLISCKNFLTRIVTRAISKID